MEDLIVEIAYPSLYPSPFVAGDLVEIQGAINANLNTQYEILSVQAASFTLRQPSIRRLLLDELRSVWLRLRWFLDDAYLDLYHAWDEAKADWRQTFGNYIVNSLAGTKR